MRGSGREAGHRMASVSEAGRRGADSGREVGRRMASGREVGRRGAAQGCGLWD